VDNIRVEDESGPKNQVPFFHNRMAKGLIETFAIEDIEASPIGGALQTSNMGPDFEEDFKNLFYNHTSLD
jgi:hypothetical protein